MKSRFLIHWGLPSLVLLVSLTTWGEVAPRRVAPVQVECIADCLEALAECVGPPLEGGNLLFQQQSKCEEEYDHCVEECLRDP
jgi:hypothetical protein